MKKILLALSLAFVLSNCTPRVVPLQGSYQSGPVKSIYEDTFDVLWESVIDLVFETGLAVRMVDKSSGLILADDASFDGLVSQENQKGGIVNPKAYIVIERLTSDFASDLNRYTTSAKWSIRVKEVSKKQAVVSVNLHSIKVDRSALPLTGKSTGNFEKWLLDSIGK